MNNEEQRLVIPWLISLDGDKNNLLVSAPDGTILEFVVTKGQADLLPKVLYGNGLWKTFFESLLESMQ